MLHLGAGRAEESDKVKSTWFASCLLAACLAAGPAAADRDCNVPLADWQPREALQKKLEAEGWTVLSIRSDDGCYKVLATDVQGARLKAKYDPASLERIRHGRDGADDD
ncbi:PepSY domain-containing protein [Xanthobacter agilis]|jgi:hypothetical protein|uniref:PepSY domain-containing protein n=1 Tax=Xanthobacter agilis TaxID=47492 RepID=UPI00372946C5